MTDEQRSGGYGDYLQALAFRILHEESLLQPRRADLFETEGAQANEYEEPVRFEIAELLRPAPVAPATVESGAPRIALPAATIPQTPVVVPEAVEPGFRRDERVEPLLTPRSALPPVAEDGATRQAADVRSPDAPRLTSTEAVRAKSGRQRARVVLDSLAQTEPRRMAEAPQGGTLLVPAISHEPRREQRPGPSGPVVAAQAAAPAAVQPQIVRVPEKAVPPQSSPLSVRVAAPPNQAVMMARMVPETRNLAPLFTPAGRAPQDETTVEITIGRLEIRAVSAPAAAPLKTAPPQPGHSLKEYLTRNARGRP